MHQSVRIVADRAAGTTRIVCCAGGPPMTPRQTGPERVHLVGSAAGPIAGDVLEVEVEVRAGARLTIAAVAATVALPGPDASAPPSRWTTRIRVEAGAMLVVVGQPLVAAAGCRHETETLIDLDGDARLRWRDLVVAGRSGESTGRLSTTQRVHRDGAAILEQQLRLGGSGWDGSAVLAGHRCAGTLVLSGPPAWQPDDVVHHGSGAVLLPLAAKGSAVATAIGDPVTVTAALDALDAQRTRRAS